MQPHRKAIVLGIDDINRRQQASFGNLQHHSAENHLAVQTCTALVWQTSGGLSWHIARGLSPTNAQHACTFLGVGKVQELSNWQVMVLSGKGRAST